MPSQVIRQQDALRKVLTHLFQRERSTLLSIAGYIQMHEKNLTKCIYFMESQKDQKDWAKDCVQD